jgi:hypothetical protein
MTDQFELLDLLIKNKRNSLLREGIAYGVAVICLTAAILAWSRPLPVVVKSDNPIEATRLVSASGDSEVRNIDAKKFLVKMASLLNGWTSTSVKNDLFEASLLMTPAWRGKFLKSVNEKVEVDRSVDPSGLMDRVDLWASQTIDNRLDLDWNQTECRFADNRWQCRARGTLQIRSLTASNAIRTVPVEVRAKLIIVPVTKSTIDGMLVDFFDLVEIES